MRDRVILALAWLAIVTGLVWAAIGFREELQRPVPQWIEPHPNPAVNPLMPGGPIR